MRFCYLVLAALVGACGSDDDDGGPSCADMMEECRAAQRGCEMQADGPVCVECGVGNYADGAGACVPIAGEPFHHEWAEFTVQPGEELLNDCQSWTLGNEEPIFVNAVELQQNESSHHSNWTFVPDNYFDGPDGVWPCDERDYHQTAAALYGGVLYAQSTQASHEVQRFPPGAVVRLPAHARIIGDIHLLNVTPEAVTGRAALTIYGIDERDVTVNLTPMHMTYDTLAIPPRSRSRFYAACDLATEFADNGISRFDVTMYYLLPHTHALGRRFYIKVIGGELDGRALLDVGGTLGEAMGRYFDPPLPLTGATGLEFGCEFDNPRDETVEWGFGDQEMCEFLGFAASSALFETRISEVNESGEVDGMPTFTGPCESLVVPWRG
jgi:hypothetical protein